MRDWIVGLLKAASEKGSGASPEELARVEAELELTLPEELRELYAAVSGADLAGEVSLHPLFADEETTGLLEQSREDLPGLPSRGILRFGLRGGAEHLFAVRHSEITPLLGDVGGWISAVPQTGWIYGIKNLDTAGIRFVRSLEVMLSELVPPATTEGFGENTFIRAFNAVQDAIQTASAEGEGEAGERTAPATAKQMAGSSKAAAQGFARGKARAAQGAATDNTSAGAEATKATATKPAARKAAAKRPAARKPAAKRPAARKAAAKKPAARKAAAKRPAARKAAAKRPAARKAAAKRPAARK
ncbi:MAG: SMI1/KNR4 family protein, partial [Myxococcota bacterium]|nr:SMI1/KNR4 family protein [Myxococcota bacterium]